MAKNKSRRRREADPGPDPKPKKPTGPDVELTPDEQTVQITEALDTAISAGLPNAGVIKAYFMLAETFWNSGMYKTAGSPAGCFVKMLYGHEMGLSPMMSMINIDIVDGQPAMSSQLMLAKFKEAGGKVEWLQRDELAAVAKVSYDGEEQQFSFTLEDAQRAGLAGKNVHQKYPKAMMGWRLVSDAIKIIAPGVLLKAYTFGELTNDQAHSLEQLGALEALPGPSAGGRPQRQQQPSQAPQQSAGNGSGKAPKPKVNFIRDQLKSPAVPSKLKASVESWLKKYDDVVAVDAANKALARLKDFQIGNQGRQKDPASQKQVDLLAKLTKSEAIPADITDQLNDLEKPFTKGMASAWIECCNWWIKDAKNGHGPQPEQNQEDADQKEFKEYHGRKDALKDMIESKVAPDDDQLKEVMTWLADGTDSPESLNIYEAMVVSWEDKATVQGDLVN